MSSWPAVDVVVEANTVARRRRHRRAGSQRRSSRWGRSMPAMREGWLGDDYLILFAEEEMADASRRYGVAELLPGFELVGLRGWDDFIVRNGSGDLFTVPTVPCVPEHLTSYRLAESAPLQEDARFERKVKWYVTPVVFGGAAGQGPNLTWVSQGEHADLVRWWNDQYRRLRRG